MRTYRYSAAIGYVIPNHAVHGKHMKITEGSVEAESYFEAMMKLQADWDPGNTSAGTPDTVKKLEWSLQGWVSCEHGWWLRAYDPELSGVPHRSRIILYVHNEDWDARVGPWREYAPTIMYKRG